jgi:UDP-N-acetylmuramate dehydrogenase
VLALTKDLELESTARAHSLKFQMTNLKIKELLPGLKENVSLANYTTFKIGGKAKYFFEAKKKKDLIKAVKIAQKFKLPFFILGEGSNLLVADEGYKGLVIKCQMPNIKCQIKSKFQMSKIYTEAGARLADLLNLALKKSLTGLEWAVGIPGTIGGAIYGNCGAFKRSMADILKKVKVFDLNDLRFKIYNLRDCKFKYRDSIFKQKKNLIIISAEIQLKKGQKKKIKNKIREYLEYRRKTQPLNFPSAGSIFKNPLMANFQEKDLPISAAFLIEKCNLKGKKIGQAQISQKNANFIVNLGKAKAKEVLKLIKLAKKRVKEKFKINLKEEIEFLGFKISEK